MNRSVTDSPVQTIGQRGEPLGESPGTAVDASR